jgi:hypothetical protein
MKQLYRLLVGLFSAGVLLALPGSASASPFLARPRPNLANPLRTLAQNQTPAPAPAAPVACTSDAQCPAETICEENACRPFERSVNVLLYRKEGASTYVIPFYWARRGVPGHRVVFPFYWHFWSDKDKAQVVAPFYWRFENYLAQRVVTVVLLYSHTRQPEAQSWALWPIFYKSTRFGWAAPLLGSFRVGDPGAGTSKGALLFLYWWSRKPQSSFDLGFPLFVSSRSPESAFTFALPLNFYWRSGTDKSLLAIPLFYWHHDARTGVLGSPLGYYSSAQGGNTRGAALWLYWWGRSRDFNYDIGFPILWSFRTPRANTTVIPPVLHLRRANSTFTTVLPLFFSASNRARGDGWSLLFPLFLSKTGEQGRSRTWITPLGGYSRDDEEGSRALTFIVPPLIWRKNTEREFSSYLLLYWRYRNLQSGASTTVIGPYVSSDDRAGSTRAGLPLFWYFRDNQNDATAHTFFPLYFRRTNPDESTTAFGVFPAWFYFRSFTGGGGSGGLFPLAFFGSRGGNSHAVLLPIFYHLKDAESSSTVLFPLFWRFADATSSNTGVTPLLYFQGHDHGSSYQVQFPLFWRLRDERAGTTTTAIPPFFYRSRRDGWSAGIAPLLFAGGGQTSGHAILFPLFWHSHDSVARSSTTQVLAYLHRQRGGETTDALFPLLWYRRGARTPGRDETAFTFFPLFHYRRDPDTRVLVTPLGGYGKGPQRAFGMVGPFFWYHDPARILRGLPPIYFDATNKATGERSRVFGPWFQIDAPDHNARVLFPLVATYRDPDDRGVYVFPNFFHRRATNGYGLDTLFPLFWISSAPNGQHTTQLGPYFRRVTADSKSIALLPLFLQTANSQRRLLVTPLLVQHENYKEGRTRTVAPLFFRVARPAGGTTVLFPFWWSGTEAQRRYRVLFPIFWNFSDDKADKSFTLAGPLLWSRKGDWRTRGLAPVAWFSRDGHGSGSDALLPIFYERHTPTDQLFVTAPFGFRSAPDNKWFYVGPFVYKDAWDKKFWTLFPVYFSHLDKGSETRTRVFPPLLLYSRSSPDRSLLGTLLLFWRQRSITGSTTLALPLFYDFQSFHESRFTMLFPLFARYRNQLDSSSTTVSLLFYRRSSPTDSTTVAFPLFWDFKGSDSRSTVVVPFYASFSRPTYQSRYIFPNIFYRSGRGIQEGTYRLFVFPLWESGVKRRGDFAWEVLLGLFGYERIGRNRFLKVLFFPIELAPVPAASTAWYSKPPRRSPREPMRGLNTQTW